jgi:hypothetical protein
MAKANHLLVSGLCDRMPKIDALGSGPILPKLFDIDRWNLDMQIDSIQ